MCRYLTLYSFLTPDVDCYKYGETVQTERGQEKDAKWMSGVLRENNADKYQERQDILEKVENTGTAT